MNLQRHLRGGFSQTLFSAAEAGGFKVQGFHSLLNRRKCSLLRLGVRNRDSAESASCTSMNSKHDKLSQDESGARAGHTLSI